MSTQTLVSGPRPPRPGGRARWRPSLRRLAHRRLVVLLVLLGVLAVVAAMVAVFATHSADASGARAEAQRQAQEIAAANATDASLHGSGRLLRPHRRRPVRGPALHRRLARRRGDGGRRRRRPARGARRRDGDGC
ncbi:hypothetical protein GCM10025868_27990 [Angustibacter aerolatus]|uniref:Uncharacterized protein n=1 Tax=Angustibacter aerolatus TaxID=1162965 RepID=A0ABQ6JJJ1_9ACTN|nr:hypothetical protein GCM10025868_27990 [Angustibacter aerolatus]